MTSPRVAVWWLPRARPIRPGLVDYAQHEGRGGLQRGCLLRRLAAVGRLAGKRKTYLLPNYRKTLMKHKDATISFMRTLRLLSVLALLFVLVVLITVRALQLGIY